MSTPINWPSPASPGMIYESDNGDQWIYENNAWKAYESIAVVEGFGATASTNCLNTSGVAEGETGSARNNQWYYGGAKEGWAVNEWSANSLGGVSAAGELELNYEPGAIFNATKIPVAYHDWDSVLNTSKDFLRISVVGFLEPLSETLAEEYKFYGATLGTTCENLNNIPVKGTGDLRYCEDADGTPFNENGTLCYYYDCSLDNFLTPAEEPFGPVVWSHLKPYNNILFGAWKIKYGGVATPLDFGRFRWSYRIDYISAKGGKPGVFE